MRTPNELRRKIARVKSLLESGETYLARKLADEIYGQAQVEQLEHEELLTLTAPYAFHAEEHSEHRYRFVNAWALALLSLRRGFSMSDYLDKLLWLSRLLIRNGLSKSAFELMESMQAELVEHVPDKFKKLLSEHATYPGFEQYYPRLVPELQLKL